MSLYLTHPYGRMLAHRHMFNRMMNNEWPGESARVAFPLDVKDTDEAYEVIAVLPGVSAEDLNIQIANDTLTIQGELKVEYDEQATYLLRERTARTVHAQPAAAGSGRLSQGRSQPERWHSDPARAQG